MMLPNDLSAFNRENLIVDTNYLAGALRVRQPITTTTAITKNPNMPIKVLTVPVCGSQPPCLGGVVLTGVGFPGVVGGVVV